MYKKVIWLIVLTAFLSFIFPLGIFTVDEKKN
jgi:hypothetical protein